MYKVIHERVNLITILLLLTLLLLCIHYAKINSLKIFLATNEGIKYKKYVSYYRKYNYAIIVRLFYNFYKNAKLFFRKLEFNSLCGPHD